MLGIGDRFPDYSLKALVPGDLRAVDASTPDDYFTTVDSSSYEGKWLVVFFWPKDFTFVCPTEIAEFGRLNSEFADRDAQVLGGSVDNEFVHYAWRTQHEDLKNLPFPMLSDLDRSWSPISACSTAEGVADRATFIVDPEGIIQFVMVTAGSVGRNVEEVLRVLDALQTDELCACNWHKGAATLDVKALMSAGA